MLDGDAREPATGSDRPWECFTPVGLRVLVVDDDKTCLRVISKMLEQCNYEGDASFGRWTLPGVATHRASAE
jgi:PleD family two-component response regulator